jgi:hypothetical protein
MVACLSSPLLACAIGIGACSTRSGSGGADSSPPEDGAAASDAGLPYMAQCTDAATTVGMPGACDPNDCAPNCNAGTGGAASPDVCFDFPNRGTYCTHACTSSSQCAAPSTGCSGMGVCKAPGANGMEAGAGDGA